MAHSPLTPKRAGPIAVSQKSPRFEISPSVVWSDVAADRLALLDSESGKYYGLDQTAAAIWRCLALRQDGPALHQAIAQSFEGELSKMQDETDAFLARLLEAGLIVKAEDELRAFSG